MARAGSIKDMQTYRRENPCGSTLFFRSADCGLWVFKGLELIAAGTTRHTVNGAFYRVLEASEEKLTLLDLATQEEVQVSTTLVEKGQLRCTRALCYASCQGATIRDTLCLHDTDHKHFSREMLLVGLSRAVSRDLVAVA